MSCRGLSNVPAFAFLMTAAAAVLAAQGPPQGKSAIKVAPDTIYLDKTGTETTLSRKVNVNRTGPPASISFTAAAATSSGGGWLAVTPSAGSVPADLTITATPGALAAGSYNGTVTVTPVGTGQSPELVNVILRVHATTGGGTGGGSGNGGGPAAAVLVRPAALNFQMVQGGANPSAEALAVSSPAGGAAFTWTATTTVTSPAGGTWLKIAPVAGVGAGSINVTVNGAGLAAGRYTGSVNIASGASTSQVQVGLEVRGTQAAKLVIDPRAFNFIVNRNSPDPSPKTMRVKNAGSGTLNWTAAATSVGGWLKLGATSGVTPADLLLSVTPSAGLAQGMYEGSVTVTANGAAETARVFLRVVGQGNGNVNGNGKAATNPNQSVVQVSPRALEFNGSGSGTLQLTSKLAGLTFAASRTIASGGVNWLSVSPAAGVVPGGVNVAVNAAGLANGVYTGVVNIAVQGAAAEQRAVPVTLRVGSGGVSQSDTPRLSVRPGAVVFQASPGGGNPAAATVTVEARGGASTTVPFTTTISTATGGNWLTASPSAGTTPATVTVNAINLASLQPGAYKGAVVFQSSTGAVAASLTVNLLIKAKGGKPVGLFLEPGDDFSAVADAPQAVRAMLFDADGEPAEGATVEVFSSRGEAPFRLEDAGNGVYTGLFQSRTGGPVALTAVTDLQGEAATFSTGGDVESASDARPVILPGGIVNAANFSPSPTPLAPGSIATLFGRGLATAALSASALPLPAELGGLKILAAGVECPLLGVVPGDEYDQVNFVIPVSLNGLTFADVVVLKDGVFSAPEGMVIARALPAIFTANGSGAGPAAALHADYSLITPGKPAVAGETILLFATGLGEAGAAQVRITIGGAVARTTYAGAAPGFAGLYQLNVVVPERIEADGSAEAALTVSVDGVGSGEGVVIPVAR